VQKTKVLKVVNIILALLFLNQACTGFLYKVLPYKLYEIIHGGGGVVLAAAVVVHVILNWGWVRANILKG
jgi:hypothetical protein